MKANYLRLTKLLGVACLAAVLAACASNKEAMADRNVGLLSSKSGAETSVNKYLWVASLETLDFLPIFTADPVGGLIITDWYANPRIPNERLKANVHILDSALRADALRVTVFKQTYTQSGWVDAPVNKATAREIENAILTRARQLRLNSIS
ncbi:MAG: DUF3576 domain-containing protein [bacterium]